MLAKIGGAIPVGRNVQTRMSGDVNPACKTLEEDDYRGVEIFPPRGSSHDTNFSTSWYEDDGLSLRPDISQFTITYGSTEEKVIVRLSGKKNNKFVPVWTDVVIVLPCGDERHVVSTDGDQVEKLEPDTAGRLRYRIAGPIRSAAPELCNGYH